MERRSPAAGVLAVVASLATAAVAAADPGPPTPPPAPPADPFAIASEQTRNDPGGLLTEMLGPGATPDQALSEAMGLSAPPPVDPFMATPLLMPQSYRMPADDQASPYPLAPNTVPSPFARVDLFKGVHALVHGGLGRLPGAELGQPLTGTEPSPGTTLPPGLEQFYLGPPPLPAPLPVPPPGG